MRNLTEENLTEAVLQKLSGCRDERAKALLGALIRHLHALVRETEPTAEEWMEAIGFLTETGQKCDDKRQEFILLSDTLGISMLVDAINNRKAQGSTESSVLGPFYVSGAPERPMGADLGEGDAGPCVLFRGRVLKILDRAVATEETVGLLMNGSELEAA